MKPKLSASKREDRHNREGMERNEAARRSSNAEQSRISPRFTEERYLQQGATSATPSPGSAYKDRYTHHSKVAPQLPLQRSTTVWTRATANAPRPQLLNRGPNLAAPDAGVTFLINYFHRNI